MKIVIINGPNLNLLGKRETSIYGSESFEVYFESLKKYFPGVEFSYYQSNIEGEIVRIEEDLKYNRGFLMNVMKKLENERFVSNAPASVLELERKKKSDAESKIKSLEEALKSLNRPPAL